MNSKDFYHYEGSLTTPPCAEVVDWFVYEEPLHIEQEVLDMMQAQFGRFTNRKVQPLNGRTVWSGQGSVTMGLLSTFIATVAVLLF